MYHISNTPGTKFMKFGQKCSNFHIKKNKTIKFEPTWDWLEPSLESLQRIHVKDIWFGYFRFPPLQSSNSATIALDGQFRLHHPTALSKSLQFYRFDNRMAIVIIIFGQLICFFGSCFFFNSMEFEQKSNHNWTENW